MLILKIIHQIPTPFRQASFFLLALGGGGVRSFFIESKFFQLILEERGRYYRLQIFERGKFFMRSVFLGKNAAQWLMSNLEHLVIGVNPSNSLLLEKVTQHLLSKGVLTLLVSSCC